MHDTVDYVMLGVVYLWMGISCGYVGKCFYHSKLLRVLEIIFWPVFGVILVLWGFYLSIANIFQEEDLK